jgi:hypothetical protein
MEARTWHQWLRHGGHEASTEMQVLQEVCAAGGVWSNVWTSALGLGGSEILAELLRLNIARIKPQRAGDGLFSFGKP